MNQQPFQHVGRNSPEAIPTEMRRIEGREWWLWGFAVAVTLALTLGIISFTFPWFNRETEASYWFDLREWVRGLAALVLLFDFYAVYQNLQLHRLRRQLAERDQLFQLISENAADMIALVDRDGRRLYNSPAYEKVLGYSPEELRASSSIEQIHPDDRVQSDSFFYLLGFVVDEVAVLHQLADQGIDLLQTEWGLGAAFQIAADKAIFLDSHFQRSGAGLIDRRGAVLLSQRKNAQDAAHTDLALLAMDGVAERSDVRPGATGPPQQLGSAQRRPLRVILFFDAIPAAPLAHVFAQQLPGFGIEQANIQFIPLHARHAPDPTRRCAVVSGLDFDAAIQMHDALAVLVIAEGFQRQRKQGGLLFGKHSGDLPFGGAVDARVGPALFPVIEVGLGFFQTLEAQAFQWRSLRMTDARFDFAFAVGILNAAGHGQRAVVREDVARKRIESGVVNVGDEHALAQIVEPHDARSAAQPAKGSFVQLGPDAPTGAEGQQTHARKPYNSSEAVGVLERVRDFMQFLGKQVT